MTLDTLSISDTLLYRVIPNDTLTKILSSYHPNAAADEIGKLTSQVVAANPQVSDPDQIHVDQLIHVPIPQRFCPAPSPKSPLVTILSRDEGWLEDLEQSWHNSDPKDKDLLSSLLPTFALGLGSAKLSTLETTFSTNAPIMRAVVKNYEDYKAGRRTRGQYDYRRSKLITELANNLGPTNLILNGTLKPQEVLRISRSRGELPTQPIQAQIRKMKQVARLAKGGGVVLTGAGLGIACQQISTAHSAREKNEIFVESAGSAAAGVLYGLGTTAGLLLLATPVGWVGALAIGAGGAVAGYSGGKIARKFYDTSGNDYDFVGKLGVDEICVGTPRRPARRINSVHSNNVIMGH